MAASRLASLRGDGRPAGTRRYALGVPIILLLLFVGGVSSRQVAARQVSDSHGVAASSNDNGKGVRLPRNLQFTDAVLSTADMANTSLSTNSTCSICGNLGGPPVVLPNVRYVTTYHAFELLPTNLTCGELEEYANNEIDPTSGTDGCLGLQTFVQNQCCDMTESIPTYQCEQSVQYRLLGEEATYNTIVAPMPSGGGKLDIDVGIFYYGLTSLSTVEGTAEINFGINVRWTDERLVWDPIEEGGCSTTSARASLDAEKTSIWIPDIDLLNRVRGVESFSDTPADVFSNGEVNWYRIGGVKVLCGFTGLERFPYDTLGCYLDFGSSGVIPRLRFVQERPGPGVQFDYDIGITGAERAKPRYQEFAVAEELTEVERVADDILRFHLYFRRAPRYYQLNIVIPTILLTFLSFGQFVLDQRVGERLGFGVSLLLVIVAQSLLTADLIPRCEEALWVNSLTQGSLYWVLLGCFESVAVAYLYYVDATATGSSSNTGHAEGSSNNNGDIGGDAEVREIDGEGSASTRGSQRQTGTPVAVQKLIQYVENILLTDPNIHETWKMRTIKIMDRSCLILLPLSYTIFFSVMIGTNSRWA